MLKNLLPQIHKPQGNNNTDCPTCSGNGFVLIERPIYIHTRSYGTITEQADCPDCQYSQHAHCEVCDDFGMVRYAVPQSDPRFGQLFPCTSCPKGKALALRALENSLEGAGLPDRYRRMSFTTWMDLPKAARAGKELPYVAAALYAQSWQAGFELSLKAVYAKAKQPYPNQPDRKANSLVFEGAPGIGKTGLAAAVCNYLVEKTPVRPLYSRCRDMVRSVQAGYGDDKPSNALERYKSADLLVIDEMNLVNSTDDRRDIIEEIVRFRHGNSLPCIITLNNTREQFEAEWGKRTATVLYEASLWFAMTGSMIRDEGTAV